MECKICGRECKDNVSLGVHLYRTHHMKPQEYYDEYVKTDESEGVCAVCGNPTRFITLGSGYHKYCSPKCSGLDPLVRERRSIQFKETTERNGGVHPSCSNYSNEKRKKTNLERYGSEYTVSSDKVINKIKQTNHEKYGTDYPLQNKEILNKTKTTLLETHDVDNPMFVQEFKTKMVNTKREHGKAVEGSGYTRVDTLIDSFGQGWYKQKVVEVVVFNGVDYIRNEELPKVIDYYKNRNEGNRSGLEKQVNDYLFQSFPSEEIVVNKKNIISPYELDFYFPNSNVAIEVNGNFYHSTLGGKGKNYHLTKTKMCEEKGVRLIHIFEYEWNEKQEICKSIISSALGVYNQRIYARDCEIREVGSNESKVFLDENHIQGSVNSSYRLGLYYNGELVQLITIGNSRFKQGEVELLRMCTKKYTQVIGGFSKLTKHQPYPQVISFVDLAKFSGSAYKSIGFSIVYQTKPSYVYFNPSYGVVSRYQAQKKRLPKLLGDKYDDSKTEVENMTENRFLMIYDCGTLKLRYEK